MTHGAPVPDGEVEAGEVEAGEVEVEAGEVEVEAGLPPLHALSTSVKRTSAIYPLPSRIMLVPLAFARALTPRATLNDLRTRTLMTTLPYLAAPPGFLVKSLLRPGCDAD